MSTAAQAWNNFFSIKKSSVFKKKHSRDELFKHHELGSDRVQIDVEGNGGLTQKRFNSFSHLSLLSKSEEFNEPKDDGKDEGPYDESGCIATSTTTGSTESYRSKEKEYNPEAGDKNGYTLYANVNMEWDPESLIAVQKVYKKMLIAIVFLTLISPLCVRYVMSTSVANGKHMENGGSLSYAIDPTGRWANDFTFIEVILLFVLVMGNFSNLVKWWTIFSGYPNSPMNGLNVELEGHVAIGTCTPILGESDTIFLRSLLGRSSTAFHTVCGRHNIEGLYMDVFANELRTSGQDNFRLNLWCAWIDFLGFLAELPLEEMTWYNNPRRKIGTGYFDHDPVLSQKPAPVQKLAKISHSVSLLSIRSFSDNELDILSEEEEEPLATPYTNKDIRVAQTPYSGIRCIRASANENVMYDLHSDFAFHGVQVLKADDSKEDECRTESQKNTALIDGCYDVYDILPMLTFLDNWLERVKRNDAARNNNSNKVALQDIFNAAPVNMFFSGPVGMAVQNKLRNLYAVFARDEEHDVDTTRFRNLTGPPLREYLCHRDEVVESVWKIKRHGMKDWDLVFSFASRGKLLKIYDDDDQDTHIVTDNTKIVKGSIVYFEQESLADWFSSRTYGTYRVIREGINHVDIKPWPKKYDAEGGGSGVDNVILKKVKKADLHLFCGQRGKAGALHFVMDYLKKRAYDWCSGLVTPPINRIKTIFSVIDARHMITEPHVYFNQSLIHFARGRQNEDRKSYAPEQDVFLVQFPQCYEDVKDNVWNSKNLVHWTLSQFIQDYARCCVSTGSNSLWDISPKGFDFLPLAGSCRVDDTAATLSHIKDKIIVHMPCFVSMGVSRPKVNDMLDTWTRWAAGNVELSWILVTSKYAREYGFCTAVYVLYLAANFVPSSLTYLGWILFFMGVHCYAFYEKNNGEVPYRRLNAIFKYWECATFSIDRITQFVPVLAILLNIAIYEQIPMLETPSRAFFWVLWVSLVRMPTLYLMDATVNMLRVFNKKTSKENGFSFAKAIWEATVFEISAMPLGILALMEGTYKGLNAVFFNVDITFWNATGVKQSDVDKTYHTMVDFPRKFANPCSFLSKICDYLMVRSRAFYQACASPRMAVTAYVSFIFTCNFVLMGYIWNLTADRTLLFCSFLSFFLNCAFFNEPWKRLMTPVRWFWSYDYNFEYYFLPLTIALLIFITKGVYGFQVVGSWFGLHWDVT